jgi:hypothetical protein
MNGPLFVEDNPRLIPGRILVDRESQVVAHVFQAGAAQEIADLERDRRDPDFLTEIKRLIDCYPAQLNRSEQAFSLASYDGTISPYQQGLKCVDQAIGRLKTLRKEIQDLAQHQCTWSDSGFCSVCSADGNA